MNSSFEGEELMHLCSVLEQVTISFAKILLQVTRPRTAILGKVPRTRVYRNILQYPEATKVPGILIVRVDSAIYFSNSNYIKERRVLDFTVLSLVHHAANISNRSSWTCRILRRLTDEEERVKAEYLPRIQYLIVEMSRK